MWHYYVSTYFIITKPVKGGIMYVYAGRVSVVMLTLLIIVLAGCGGDGNPASGDPINKQSGHELVLPYGQAWVSDIVYDSVWVNHVLYVSYARGLIFQPDSDVVTISQFGDHPWSGMILNRWTTEGERIVFLHHWGYGQTEAVAEAVYYISGDTLTIMCDDCNYRGVFIKTHDIIPPISIGMPR
jgi:hypothetical protein